MSDDYQLLELLDGYDPNWREKFGSVRSAAEYYGLEEQIEYDALSEDLLEELNFND